MSDRNRLEKAKPRTALGDALRAVRARAVTLPGKLFALALVFVFIAEVLVFFPSAASFRIGWLIDRAEAAHLAAIAAEQTGEAGIEADIASELLEGAEVVAVARVYEGRNEIVLIGDVGAAPMATADLTDRGLFSDLVGLCRTLFAPAGRYVRIIAEPRTRPGERISVIVPEQGLREELAAFSVRIFWLSLFIAGFTAFLLFLALFRILVRPMQKLAEAMTAFQTDPADPTLSVRPTSRRDELGEAQNALAAMQEAVRDAFRQRERLAALGGAVARINHDLRNVLASAQLVSDRLAGSRDERVAAMGARLVRAVDRGIRLCEDTLRYGRSQDRPAEMRAVFLMSALDDAAGDAFAATGAAEWRNEVDEILQVEADPDHLHRIFLNLFRNAVQAMDGAGERALEVSARHVGATVAVSVRDSGPGVPDRVRETLFEAFGRTASKGGSGLGLSIARDLARAMGGDVRLADTGPQGSVFEVTLQAAD